MGGVCIAVATGRVIDGRPLRTGSSWDHDRADHKGISVRVKDTYALTAEILIEGVKR